MSECQHKRTVVEPLYPPYTWKAEIVCARCGDFISWASDRPGWLRRMVYRLRFPRFYFRRALRRAVKAAW